MCAKCAENRKTEMKNYKLKLEFYSKKSREAKNSKNITALSNKK